jgi:hypothetical protein
MLMEVANGYGYFNSRAKETKGLTSQSIFDKAKPECIDFRSSAYNFPSIRNSHAQFTNYISYFQRLDLLPPDIPTYLTCNAAPSQYPSRQFCSVCSFQSSYKCSKCGMKYCSVKCLRTHEETRFALTIQVYTV